MGGRKRGGGKGGGRGRKGRGEEGEGGGARPLGLGLGSIGIKCLISTRNMVISSCRLKITKMV